MTTSAQVGDHQVGTMDRRKKTASYKFIGPPTYLLNAMAIGNVDLAIPNPVYPECPVLSKFVGLWYREMQSLSLMRHCSWFTVVQHPLEFTRAMRCDQSIDIKNIDLQIKSIKTCSSSVT